MNWFLLACIAPMFWALTNYFDKALLSRMNVHTGVSTIMLFSSLISIISIPLIFFFAPDIHLSLNASTLYLLIVGVLYALGIWAYMIAMNAEEASIVVPFFQLAPLLTLFFAFVFLGEKLLPIQLLAGAAITLGALILTVDITQGYRFRKTVAVAMLVCCTCLALASTLFKYAALEDSFWTSWLWEQIGLGLVGCVLFAVPTYRRDFMRAVAHGSRRFMTVNIVNEVLTLIGNMLQRYASLLAPVALVVLISNAVQPVYVLLMGVLLTLFFPHIIKENVTKHHVVQKILAISIMVAGTYWLGISS